MPFLLYVLESQWQMTLSVPATVVKASQGSYLERCSQNFIGWNFVEVYIYCNLHVLRPNYLFIQHYTDVDECSEGTHQCADAEDCMDTEGSHTCREAISSDNSTSKTPYRVC